MRLLRQSLRVVVALLVALVWLAALVEAARPPAGAPTVSFALAVDVYDPSRLERELHRDQRQLEARVRAAHRRAWEEERQEFAATLSHRSLTSREAARRTVAERRIMDLVPMEYRALVLDIAEQFDLDPRILAAVGSVESQWYALALGTHGDSGLMQILPETARWIASRLGWERYDLYDPETNLTMGAWYLYVLNREYGNWYQALAAYNGGPRAAPQGAAHPYAQLVMQVYHQGR